MSTLYHATQQSSIPATPGIYKIICTVTGKFYIGSAVNLRRRWREHLSDLRRNDHPNPKLQRAWNKHTESAFVFEIIEMVLIPELLTAREQYWLDKLKPFGKRGFNLAPTAGSTLGMTHSPETLANLKIVHLGQTPSPETREKLRIAGLGNTRRRGKKASPETRARMSTAHLGNISNLGKKASPETIERKRIANTASSLGLMKTLIVTSPDGIEYTIVGINKFCKEHGLHDSHLMQVAKGHRAHHKGWKARYPTDAG